MPNPIAFNLFIFNVSNSVLGWYISCLHRLTLSNSNESLKYHLTLEKKFILLS